MADKELLELAAKAMKDAGDPKFMNFEAIDDTCVCLELGAKRGAITSYWKPLTDDGDAMRLSIGLRLKVAHYYYEGAYYCRVYFDDLVPPTVEFHAKDPYAASRRAIVRAAAEIGKNAP